MKLSDLPALGQPLDAGIFAGLTTDKTGVHYAVALLPDRSDKRLTWKQAKAWAEKLEAVLPTRPVSALLFANVKDQVEVDWYWTSEELDRSYALLQTFDLGGQFISLKSYEGRAVAVRLIQLTASARGGKKAKAASAAAAEELPADADDAGELEEAAA